MKQVLGVVVLLSMVAAWGSAGATVYQPVKDAFWRYDVNSGNETYGGATAQRVGKGWQDGFFMDFNRAQILADAAVILGHAVTADDFTNGNISVTLSLMATDSNDAFNHSAVYTPGYFTSTTNWTENGATYNQADKTAGIAWNSTGTNIRACPTTKASSGTVWAAPNYTYQDFALDAAIASGYLLNTSAGVAITAYGDDWSNNGWVSSKEATYNDAYAGPKLTVSVVPEPATLALLALSGLLLARRRQA